MLKFHVREFLCDIDRWIHVAKRRCENQIGALQGHLCHHTLGVCALWDAFNENGFDFIAELRFDSEAAFVVLIGPAAVADGANIDKADFGFVFSEGTCGHAERHGSCGEKVSKFHSLWSPRLDSVVNLKH